VILAFIAAIIVFGLAMNTRASLQQAVREGARQASVGKTIADVQNLAAGNAPDVIGASNVKVCHPTGSGLQGDVGSPVEVSIVQGGTAGYKYKLSESTGIFGGLFGLGDITITMDPKATARLETMAFPVVAC
jgi:hypothetical protein